MHTTAILMPVLDEAENLRWLLPQLVDRYRVIVIDNGSHDDSSSIAAELGAEVVHFPKRGYGGAVLAGWHYLAANDSAGECDVVVIMDADGSSSLQSLEDVAAKVRSGVDLAIAQRTSILRGAVPAHARFGNWLSISLIGKLTGHYYVDLGPLRALKPATFHKLQMEDTTWGWNVEMQIKAVMFGLRIFELESSYQPRKHGQSKISGNLLGSLRAGVRIIYAIAFYYAKARRARSGYQAPIFGEEAAHNQLKSQ